MSTIMLNDLLRIQAPHHYKLHLAGRNPEGKRPLDEYAKDRSKWLGWNKWRGRRDDWSRKYVFSLIEFYPRADSWMFGGVFKVLNRSDEEYEIEEVGEFQKYEARLLVLFHRYQGMMGRAFCLENYLDKFEVATILPEPYSGEPFPGYDWLDHDFHRLEPVFSNERPDWKARLSSVTGVYLICDKSNGKKYVGSAYGEGGIWSRWASYMGTGHGGNNELTSLINQEGIEYARQNFKFSLLEVMTMKTPEQIIIDREAYWKCALLTREHGYNKN